MQAHPVKVLAHGYANRDGDDYFADSAFSNETALFTMSNGASMRICEYREIGHPEREIFRIYGTHGSFENDTRPPTAPWSRWTRHRCAIRCPRMSQQTVFARRRAPISTAGTVAPTPTLSTSADAIAHERVPRSTSGSRCAIWQQEPQRTSRPCRRRNPGRTRLGRCPLEVRRSG